MYKKHSLFPCCFIHSTLLKRQGENASAEKYLSSRHVSHFAINEACLFLWQVPWVSRYADPVMATGYHMLLGGIPLLALSIAQESDILLDRLPQLTGEHSNLPVHRRIGI